MGLPCPNDEEEARDQQGLQQGTSESEANNSIGDSMLNLRGQTPSSSPFSDFDLSERIGASDAASDGRETFNTVLKYSSLILLGPIVAFFLVKFAGPQRALGFSGDAVTTNVVSALAAVVVLHVGLGLFIYKAYFETPPPPKVKIGKQE